VNWIENEDGLQTVSLIFSPFNMWIFKVSEISIYDVEQKSLERFNVDLPDGHAMYDVGL
jgi:hypothetical protein